MRQIKLYHGLFYLLGLVKRLATSRREYARLLYPLNLD